MGADGTFSSNKGDFSMSNATTKSSKFAEAVGRATGQEIDVRQAGGAVASIELPAGMEGMVGTYRPDDVVVEMAKGTMEWAPRVLKLEEGMLIEGILEGQGGLVEMEEIDRAAGLVTIKTVQTWVIRNPRNGLRASFLSAAQLEDKLPPFVGGLVKIYVGPMLESRKGHRYRDFLVGGAKLPDGKTRSFARALPAPAIDASVTEAPSAES
jgi:hypothetical protein